MGMMGLLRIVMPVSEDAVRILADADGAVFDHSLDVVRCFIFHGVFWLSQGALETA